MMGVTETYIARLKSAIPGVTCVGKYIFFIAHILIIDAYILADLAVSDTKANPKF